MCFLTWKPNPWGIKVWCAADPRSGNMLEFDIYVGHVLAPMPHGLGHHVIMKMADRSLERGHHLFFVNYFSSVKLGQDLEGKGTYMCSTIRMNWSGWPKELNAQCAKKINAGDVHFCQYGNTVATQWKDKWPVAILYTNTQPEMGEAERKVTWEERGLTNSLTEECQRIWEKITGETVWQAGGRHLSVF